MTDLKSTVQVVLQDAVYETWLLSVDGLPTIGFEDNAVMGFVCLFEDAATLLRRWRDLETKLLTVHASSLQKAGEKTWNVYSVFLCSSGADDTQLREIRWIEEDLERTRTVSYTHLDVYKRQPHIATSRQRPSVRREICKVGRGLWCPYQNP